MHATASEVEHSYETALAVEHSAFAGGDLVERAD